MGLPTAYLLPSNGAGVVTLAAAAAAAAPSPVCPVVAPAYHAATTCGAGVSGDVRIPAVRKGLNNQRMRIVQDAVIAALLGAAVELPSVLRTRRRCGYRARCYQDYEGTVPFDAVYDRERVVEGLRRAGVCVVDTRGERRAPELAGALWPATASQLGPGGDVARRSDLRGGVWSLGGEEDCCTKLVVDTRRSLDLLTSVNAAFSSRTRSRGASLRRPGARRSTRPSRSTGARTRTSCGARMASTRARTRALRARRWLASRAAGRR